MFKNFWKYSVPSGDLIGEVARITIRNRDFGVLAEHAFDVDSLIGGYLYVYILGRDVVVTGGIDKSGSFDYFFVSIESEGRTPVE